MIHSRAAFVLTSEPLELQLVVRGGDPRASLRVGRSVVMGAASAASRWAHRPPNDTERNRSVEIVEAWKRPAAGAVSDKIATETHTGSLLYFPNCDAERGRKPKQKSDTTRKQMEGAA